ncbi:hypothetical protein AG0111_0g11304 [Alternaria gaisen]|uniref:Uncharacterized protein n=1 Tax=Alternaria gaisen TaxID=167740 RepID=A0ACB6F7N0_9PLEO|nr:hypothetical protein AG0111_0g11304 [Alternaria gaisen]
MPGVTTSTSDSMISPITGKPIARHEAAGLKGLTREQHPKFWEEVRNWTTDHFSSVKWHQVVKCIWLRNQEDNMMVIGWHPPPRPIHSIIAPRGRHVLLYSSSSFTAPTGAHPLRPANLPRIETGSPTTPRPRWDVVSAGPATPLSATAGPIKNAFAEGGHWASLTPKMSVNGTPTATTPVAAVPVEIWEPSTPTDPATKAVYEDAKNDVNKMALQLCASRHALRRSFSAENDVIHPSMVRPRDTLLAVQLTLESYQVPSSLAEYIDAVLPSKLEAYADEEAASARQYNITSGEMLEDKDAWLGYDEQTGEFTTILEARRDLLRMNRERRKGRDVAVGEGGVRLAWATKVVCDIEGEMERRRELDAEDSDDEGYDYSNFVRSLSARDSPDTDDERWSGSTLDLMLTNSSTTYSSSRESELDIPLAQRSSSSPVKPTYGHNTLPLRNRTFTLSNLLAGAASSDPHTHSHADSYPAKTCKSRFSPNNYAHSVHSLRRSNTTNRSRHSLRIDTSDQYTSSSNRQSSLISPQERGTRRRGPSMQALSSWADELKKMEKRRAEMRLGVCESNTALSNRREISEEETVHEEQDGGLAVGIKDGELVVDAKDDGYVINGCMHPALRGGGEDEREQEGEGQGRRSRRATGSSTKSWRCNTAVEIERDSHEEHDNPIYNSSSNDQENQVHDVQYEDHMYDDDYHREEYNDDDDEHTTTPTPEHADRSSHPLRSSSSPTHAPIKRSSLQSALAKQHLSPPRHPPRPPPLLIPPPKPMLHPPVRYNRHAATSYERQASKLRREPWYLEPRRDSEVGVESDMGGGGGGGGGHAQVVISKAKLLEESAMRTRGYEQMCTQRSTSRVGQRSKREEEENEWGAKLRAMEGREKKRQLELLRVHRGEGG